MNQKNINKARLAIKYGTKDSIKSCIILMGFPGTGKSYTSHYLNEKYGYTILSGENITHAIFGTEKCTGPQYVEAYFVLNFLANEIIEAGYKIVIDGTNLKKAFRTSIYDSIGKTDAEISGIYLYIDDEIAFSRANSRGIDSSDPTQILSSCSKETFSNFKELLEMPDKDENFYLIKSDENLLKVLDDLILR